MAAGQRGPSTSTSKYAPGRAPAQKTPGQIVKGGGIAGVPANDACAASMVIFDGVTAFDNIGATTDGPAEAGCGFCCGDLQINQDIWYDYFASQTGTVTVSLCGSGYDTKVGLYDGCGCPVAGAPLACNDDSCGLQSNISAAVTAGNCYKLRVGAYAANSGAGTINITYGGGGGNPACGAAATHDCFTTGGPGCTDEVCCNLVCGLDSFCCATAWDGICVSEANANCRGGVTPCDDPNNHPCDVTGGPGCSDHDCCTTVCALDSFCCQVAWDAICVNEASSFCGPPCPTDCPAGSIQENEPCGSDLNGGCNSTPPVYTPIACGQTVCANQWADGNIRDTDWYQFSIAQDQTSVNWSVYAAFPSVAFLLNNDCGNIALVAPAGTGNCPVRTEATGCTALNAGTYVAFAAPAAFTGLPCGGKNNAYYGVLTCTLPCLTDINHDGTTNTADLLQVINHWGPCP
jgi:hypothetical protein